MSWPNSSVTLLVINAPWKNSAFWADWTFGFCRAKFRGAFFLLFYFQGGLKMPLENQGGTFYHLSFFRGAFFGSKIALQRSKKNSGGLAPYVWKFRGAYFYNLSWSEKAPMNFRRFLLQIFRCAGIAGLSLLTYHHFCQLLAIFESDFLSHKQHLKAFRNPLPPCVSKGDG